MQGLSNALPSKTIGQKVAENEGFEFKQNNSKKVAFFGIFRQKWQPSFKTDVSNYQKNLLSHWITTEEVSSSHFTNHNYDHNVRMNGGEVFSLPNDANSRQKHKIRFTPNAVN